MLKGSYAPVFSQYTKNLASFIIGYFLDYTLIYTFSDNYANTYYIWTNFYEKQTTFTNVVANATIYECKFTYVVANETIAEASRAGGRSAPLMPLPASAEERGWGQSGL